MNWKCDYCTSINKVIFFRCSQCGAPKSAERQSFIKVKSPITNVEFSSALAKANWNAINQLVSKHMKVVVE